MARGGKRDNAGRKKGSVSEPTRLRVAVAEQALRSGLTPLDYMLSILRDESRDEKDRFAAAKEAAPYLHPRLASVEANVKVSEHEDAVRSLAAVVSTTEEHERPN
jgi:hypothetical protein